MAKAGHELAGTPGMVAGAVGGYMAPTAIGKGARMVAANPLISRLYSTQAAPFTAPGIVSPNLLAQLGAPDRRQLPGSATYSPPHNTLSGLGAR